MLTRSPGKIFWALATLMLLAGPFLGAGVHRYLARNEEARVQLRFDDYMTEVGFQIEKKILTFVEVLTALKSFFESSESVTRDEFARFTSDALSRHSLLASLEWVPMVSFGMREMHEKEMRIGGFPEYRIRNLKSSGALDEDEIRDRYFPVCYAEPFGNSLPAVGTDLGSEKKRRQAILAALESDRAVLSEPLLLDREGTLVSGIQIFLHVEATDPDSPHQNPTNCEGLVMLEFEIARVLAETVLSDPVLDEAGYTLELSDTDVGGNPQVLFSHASEGAETEVAVAREWSVAKDLKVGGRSWVLAAAPSTAFLNRHLSGTPRLVGVAAAVVWELLWLALIAVADWTKNTLVNRQNRILDSVLLSMSEGVVVADLEGEIMLVNHAAALQLGVVENGNPSSVSNLGSICRLPDGQTPFPPQRFPLTRAMRGERIRDEVVNIPQAGSKTGTWLSVNAAPLMSPDGNFHGGLAVLHDITASKDATEFAERLNKAVEHTDDTVFITGRDGVIQYVNQAFQKTTGYTRSEALGSTPRILKSEHTPPEHYTELWSTILRGQVFRKMIINRKKSGEFYYADQTITPMRDLSGDISHFVAVVKDMTEYRQLREKEVEMDIAARVQQRLYPQEPPSVPGLDIAGAVFSAEATCGDYFDYIPMPDGNIGLAVGDVSGHGLGPAMVMAETRAYLRSLAATNLNPADIFIQVNASLIQDLEVDRFVTLILACIDPLSRRLSYCSAGHDTCYVLDRSGNSKLELRSTGMPLGLAEDGHHHAGAEIVLEAGDLIVLLTDGLTECRAHHGEFLPIEEFLDLIRACRAEPAATIVDRLHSHIDLLMAGEPQNDDITILVCKVV